MLAQPVHPVDEIERERLLLRGQVDILSMIARDHSMTETLEAVVNLAEKLVPNAVAGITIVDRSEQSLEMAVFPSVGPEFAHSIAGVPLGPPHVGTCAQALYRGEIVTSENLKHDSRFAKDWIQLCEKHGIRSCRSHPVRTAAGAPLGTFMLCFREPRSSDAFDGDLITACANLVELTLERRRTRDRRDLLIDETQHRMKNIFASVEAIAHFSAQHSADVKEFEAAFRGRLSALKIAHSLIFGSSCVELSVLLQQVLKPYGSRYKISGPPILLAPQATSSFSIAFHELATNAAKYGSLSNDTGRLDIAWDATPSLSSEEVFSLKWVEEGGPAVTAPSRHGFGTRAIEKLLAREIEGKVLLDFVRTGLRCEITAPFGSSLGRRS